MSIDRFLDRFEVRTYEHDEPILLFLVESRGAEEDCSVPERLWHRLHAIASAYELHLLPVMGWSSDPCFLNATQCESLIDELEFVGAVVDDPVLHGVVRDVVGLASRTRGASKAALGIEF